MRARQEIRPVSLDGPTAGRAQLLPAMGLLMVGVMAGRSTVTDWDAHEESFKAALREVAQSRTIDASGQRITAERLEEILELAKGPDERPVLTGARFDKAVFEGSAQFERTYFRGHTRFEGATFRGGAGFEGVTFEGDAGFLEAAFEGEASFQDATFGGRAGFAMAAFKGDAVFWISTFEDRAGFERTAFSGFAGFEGTTFKGDAWFLQAYFGGTAQFDRITFEGDAGFERTVFDDEARLADAVFEKLAHFDGTEWRAGADFAGARFGAEARFVGANFGGKTRFLGASLAEACNFSGARFDGEALTLDETTFPERIAIAGEVGLLSGRNAVFLSGADIRLPNAEAQLEKAEFAGPSVLSDARILSLREARVSDLTLAGVDLSECHFVGARGLDTMRLEGDSRLPWSPRGWRWTPRRVILDERVWRAQRSKAWAELDPEHPRDAVEPDSRRIAATYRGLRKAKEDSKDEPGAADFYYGEMEMRRHAPQETGGGVGARLSFWGERVVMTAYWLVSGYGLRASRALICLAIAVAGGAALFSWVGFRDDQLYDPPYDQSYGWALLLALEAAVSLLRAPEVKLTAWGEVVQIALRILGPLFVGLTLLALRGRVKR
jgi:uncharacterized protein YjbI with pentapeptide repeats